MKKKLSLVLCIIMCFLLIPLYQVQAANTFKNAKTIKTGKTTTAKLTYEKSATYKFTTTKRGYVIIKAANDLSNGISSPGRGMRIELFDSNKELIYSVDETGVADFESTALPIASSKKKTFYLRITSLCNLATGDTVISTEIDNTTVTPSAITTKSTMTHNIKFSVVYKKTGNYEVEPNETPTQANALKLNKIYKATLSGEDTDSYKVNIPKKTKLNVVFSLQQWNTNTAMTQTYMVYFFDEAQRMIDYSLMNGRYSKTITVPAGYTYIVIRGSTTVPVGYNLKLTTGFVPSKPALQTAKKGNLKWSKSAGATKYYIYRSTNKKTWTRIATVKASVLNYTDKVGAKKKTYYYKVVAYNAIGKKASAVVSNK